MWVSNHICSEIYFVCEALRRIFIDVEQGSKKKTNKHEKSYLFNNR